MGFLDWRRGSATRTARRRSYDHWLHLCRLENDTGIHLYAIDVATHHTYR
ncbi:hypothetical protein JTE88_02555 [Arcanobacterium phocisimile]|uniref:Transposase n=1 Tax=Arcanobacterium phocisimile TaxID=1302235 RepID=A0ABX7IMS2_9ACTO|nr:hypothetical protein [Arcanobacterium phocisimile]QRV03083.1 hypothetical protein JTE88_02555 [Arcanobacterium phocisimile]